MSDTGIKRKTLAANDNTEVIVSESRYGEQNLLINRIEVLDERARLAAQFAERWALVACEIDGEDSAGRSKLRRLSPGELAVDVCRTVTALYEEFAARGWILTLPPYEEAVKFDKPKEEKE
jgi:hypothetical protein